MIINYPTYSYNNSNAKYISLNISSNEPYNDDDNTIPLINLNKTTIEYNEDEESELNQIIITHNNSNGSSINYYQVDDINISEDFDTIIHKLTVTINDKHNIYRQQYIDNYYDELLNQLYAHIYNYRDKRNQYNDIVDEMSKINENLIHLTAIDNVDLITNNDVKNQIDELNKQYEEYKTTLETLKQDIINIISNIKKLKNVL